MSRTIKWLITAVTVFAVALVGLQTTPVSAAIGSWVNIPSYCGDVKNDVGLTRPSGAGTNRFADGKYQSFGTDTPIILIHGYGGMNKAQWGSLRTGNSFSSKLNNIPGATVATEFQYDTGAGVYDFDYQANFQPFANAIDCIARISKKNGGFGKVIIVSYSQGSSTTHGASVLDSADGKRKIANQIGQAISIADARIAHPRFAGIEFEKGYPAPNFPKVISSVHTIAGNVANIARNKQGVIIKTSYTQSDDIIRVNNAIRQYSDNWESGGGNFVASCYREFATQNFKSSEVLSDAPCRHGELLNYSPVQSDAVAAVTAYVNSLTSSNDRTWTIANSLTLHLDDSWGEIQSASGQETEGYTNELGTDKEIQAESGSYLGGDLDKIYFGESGWLTKTGDAPTVEIGGRTPDYSAQFTESNTNPARHGNLWCFSPENICVLYRGGETAADANPSSAVRAVFSTATWSS